MTATCYLRCSWVHIIIRNISSPRLPLSLFFVVSAVTRPAGKRKLIVVANGPSSWRHGRGNGSIKLRRAARDLLIVVASAPTVAPREGLPPESSSLLFLLLPPSYVTRVRTPTSSSSFSTGRSRMSKQPSAARLSAALPLRSHHALHPVLRVFSFFSFPVVARFAAPCCSFPYRAPGTFLIVIYILPLPRLLS